MLKPERNTGFAGARQHAPLSPAEDVAGTWKRLGVNADASVDMRAKTRNRIREDIAHVSGAKFDSISGPQVDLFNPHSGLDSTRDLRAGGSWPLVAPFSMCTQAKSGRIAQSQLDHFLSYDHQFDHQKNPGRPSPQTGTVAANSTS